jgi:enoyl-CoA hydratase/carnithine racemase
MTSATDKILSATIGHVGLITFNNPERHNAVSLEMWETVARTFERFVADDAVRVIVLTGAGGKAFVSGADISKFESERATREAVERYNRSVEAINAAIYDCPKPTIAMIRGFCMGGGLGLAMCCDIRICSDGSRFALPAAKLGLGYGYPGIKRFIDVAGAAVAKEVFLTAKQYEAGDALRMGLVNHVLADAEVEAFAMGMAETIAANAPLTVRAIKGIAQEAVRDSAKRDLAKCDALVRACFDSADYIEGRRAFMEKRKPNFQGR